MQPDPIGGKLRAKPEMRQDRFTPESTWSALVGGPGTTPKLAAAKEAPATPSSQTSKDGNTDGNVRPRPLDRADLNRQAQKRIEPQQLHRFGQKINANPRVTNTNKTRNTAPTLTGMCLS